MKYNLWSPSFNVHYTRKFDVNQSKIDLAEIMHQLMLRSYIIDKVSAVRFYI